MVDKKYFEELKSNLMRLDVEELEDRRKKGLFDDDVIDIVDEVISYKNSHPDEIKTEKTVSPMTRRIVTIAAVGVVGNLYFWLKRSGKSKKA